MLVQVPSTLTTSIASRTESGGISCLSNLGRNSVADCEASVIFRQFTFVRRVYSIARELCKPFPHAEMLVPVVV